MTVDPLLPVKLVAVPVLVLAASLAARRWGPSVGGFVIGLPLTSGPVLVFLALEQGVGFASSAAVSTLLGVVPLSVYCLTYARAAFRFGWRATLALSTMVYFAIAAVLSQVDTLAVVGLGAALTTILASLYLMPRSRGETSERPLPRWEILARIVAATSLVILITEGASLLGPRWSGLLAPYPIYATVFAVFMHRFDGPTSSGPFLRGVVASALSSSAFFFTFSSTVLPLGIAISAILALSATVLVQGTMLFAGAGLWRDGDR